MPPLASGGSAPTASATPSPTWAIAHDSRELDVQHLLGHSSAEMVRHYSATYGSAQAAERHAAFSPGDGMLAQPHEAALQTSLLHPLTLPCRSGS